MIGKKVQRIMMSNITVIDPVTLDASGAGLDVRGIVTLANIHVVDVAAGRWAISLRNTYVSEAEIGARRSTLTNFYLEGAPGNGSMGLRIVAGEVGISNGFIQGFDYGVAVLGALPVETFLPTARVGLSNVIATKSGRKGFFFGVAAKEISCVNCWAYENLNDGVEIQADQVSWIGGGMTDNGGRGLVVKSQLLAAGSRLQLLGIQGVRMANSGTATIAGGSTAVVVPHGLWFTPEAQQIQVVPTNNEATSFWVSDVTAASFTINVAADPGETTATYAWRATWQ